MCRLHFVRCPRRRAICSSSVVDELTYYAEGAPFVTNATVTLRDPVSHDAITNLNTGANGTVYSVGRWWKAITR